MKKLISATIYAAIVMAGWAGSATATSLTESFFGTGSDSNFVELWENSSVSMGFDFNGINPSYYQPQPTSDAFGFNDASMDIVSGVLNFTFSSSDLSTETVQIHTGFYDGNTLVKEITYNLGYILDTVATREYAELELDLFALGLGDYLQDGYFQSIVFSPVMVGDNDIRLDYASITVETAPVPEPATMLLFGAGIVGLAGIGRRKRNKV